MRYFTWPSLAVLAISGILMVAGGPAALAQGKVGVNAAVNQDAQGTPPGGTTRKLVLGQEVVHNERIATTANGQTQLVFLDESAMTVGPNSEVTIDEFVYDPKTGAGRLAATTARGVLRFVGGKLSKQEDAVAVKTPSTRISVRGGVFLLKRQPNGDDEVFFVFGDELIIGGVSGVTQRITRPGFEVLVRAGVPSPPFPAPPGAIAGLLTQLDGRAGGTGGVARVPSEATVASSGVSQTISGNVPASIQAAAAGLPQAPQFTAANLQNTLSLNTIQSTGFDTVSNSETGNLATTTTTPPPPPPPPNPTVVIAVAGTFKSTNGKGAITGFDPGPGGTAAYSGGTLTFANAAAQTGSFTANVPGLGQVTLPVVPGFSSSGAGTSSPLGPVAYQSFMSPDRSYFYANLAPLNAPTERAFISGGVAATATGANTVSAYAVQPDAALRSGVPFLRNNAGGIIPNAATSPYYVVAPASTPLAGAAAGGNARGLQASVAINDQGANQQSAIAVQTSNLGTVNGAPAFGGQFRGSALLAAAATPVGVAGSVTSARDANGNSLYGTSGISGFALDQGQTQAVERTLSTSAQGTNYTFNHPATVTTVPNGVGASRTTQSLSGWFGGINNTTAQTTPYAVIGANAIATDAAQNSVTATFAGAPTTPAGGLSSIAMQYGGATGAGAGVMVDNANFAAVESQTAPSQVNGQNATNSRLYMVSSSVAPPPASLLPQGASYCACNYLQWGYWGGDVQSGGSGGTPARLDRGHLNFWVAGQPTPAADITALQNASVQNAQASYTGHAIGAVYNAGSQYTAAGGFQANYNFANRAGSFAITNYDGRNFNGTIQAGTPLSGANYSFPLNATPGFNGIIAGSFYGPQAANTGGSFAINATSGPTYLTSGIYAGRR